MNQLLLGDNLEILRAMSDESIDLIYLDPPFFSNRTYEVIWGDKGEVRSFEDRFSGGIDHYIAWLKDRVQEMHRILKPTGSIFLHCDWHANAYIRVLILDKIFGTSNFKNEITWQRTTTHNDTKQGAKHFGRVTDTIFYYAKNNKLSVFNPQYQRYTSNYEASSYSKQEENGRRFKASDLSAAKGGGDTSYEWNGKKPPLGRYWAYSRTNMEKFEKENRIYYSTTGRPYLKQYLDEMPGTSVDEMWFNCVFKDKKERIGYPTQKPMALLERIIKTASNEGDTVLDPFVGGGTTVAVADKLGRNWVGIDQSVSAVKVTEMRLNAEQDLFSKPFTLRLHKYDYDTVRNSDAFEFESFIITQYGGQAQNKKGGDLGLDGKTKTGVAIQVKRSDNIGRNVVDNFHAALQRFDQNLYDKYKASSETVGIIIAFSFGKGAVQEVARLRNEVGVIIELVTVETIIPLAKKPTLTVTVHDLGKNAKGLQEIQFIATAESEAGISFYNWDFNYTPPLSSKGGIAEGFKPSVLLDTTGKQTQTFKAGQHNVMINVIDNEGLESVEIIRLKINGKVVTL